MNDAVSTGQAAAEIGVSEPRLQELIRRGKVVPPKKVNGRRRWKRAHIDNAKSVVGRNE